MGGRQPAPDPRMGIAAEMSAQTGRDMLAWMKDQAKVTNQWAADDRARYQTTFQPIEDAYIADATKAADPANIGLNAANRAAQAEADVRQTFGAQRGQQTRQLTAMGVNPASGRFASTAGAVGQTEALAVAGAGNLARRQSIAEDEAKAEAMRTNVLNMGKGLAVNPATSMGLSNSAGGAGFQGAISGYGQQANILNTDYQNRLSAWQTKQNGIAGLAGGLGSILGALPAGTFASAGPLAFLSSKDMKTNKQPLDTALGAVRKMPVEKWDYKPGHGDGGTHIGPYAEDFHAATGIGDGKTIDAISLAGITLGAVRDLDRKVAKLEAAA